MEAIKRMILKKPPLFVVVTLVYTMLIILLKWKFSWNTDILWYSVGSVIGLYLIDVAEAFTNITPSPFRTGLFCYLFVILSLFIVSSSGNILAIGLVLSLYLTMILWQTGHMAVFSHLDHWYKTISGPMAKKTQTFMYFIVLLIFLFETLLFVRS